MTEQPRRLENKLAALFGLLSIVIATLLICRADLAYNQVFDEGAHIACGMEWLSHGKYTYETLHPPLARVATAILPYAAGARSQGHSDMAVEGTAIINRDGRYAHNLLLSRLGILPFFWLTCLLSYLFMLAYFSAWHGAISVFFLSFCPVVLAHSAVATTDAPLMATFLAAVLGFAIYLRSPTLPRALLASVCLGIACVTKFSAIPFFVVTSAILVGQHMYRHREFLRPLRRLLFVGVCSLPILWAAYRFSYHPLFTPADTYPKAQVKLDAMSARNRSFLTKVNVPAPELFRGMYLIKQNGDGTLPRYGYLLGRLYTGGNPAFFPVALFIKTPIAMLLLCLAGVGIAWRFYRLKINEEVVVLFSGLVGPLLVGVLGNMNIGLRHILPVYPFLGMFASIAVVSMWSRRGAHGQLVRGLVFVLLIWNVTSCLLAAPQYLSYFNEFAASRPGHFLVDSDLDWGQDFYKLESKLSGVPPADVSVDYFGDGTIARHESAQWHTLKAGEHPTGWVAVSETRYEEHPELFTWLSEKPFTWVGRTIRLYHVAMPANTNVDTSG